VDSESYLLPADTPRTIRSFSSGYSASTRSVLRSRRSHRYRLVATTNLFGDTLYDQTSMLAGGVGIAPSLNAGHEHAMAQAVHVTAPDIAGRGIANPSVLILAALNSILENSRRFGEAESAPQPLFENRSARQKAVALAYRTPQTQVAEVGRRGASQQDGAHRLETDGYGGKLRRKSCARCVGRRSLEISQTRGATQLQPC
jgi:hypothetical protein